MKLDPVYVVVIVLGVIAWVALFLLRRRAGPRRLDPESRFIVRITDTEVSCERPDGKTERVAWDDLLRVEVLTTSDGPMSADVFWMLHGTNQGCAIPQGATGDRELLERLQKLPGFDNGKFIEAMGSTNDQKFLCWQRKSET
jgi:hypothetical protein